MLAPHRLSAELWLRLYFLFGDAESTFSGCLRCGRPQVKLPPTELAALKRTFDQWVAMSDASPDSVTLPVEQVPAFLIHVGYMPPSELYKHLVRVLTSAALQGTATSAPTDGSFGSVVCVSIDELLQGITAVEQLKCAMLCLTACCSSLLTTAPTHFSCACVLQGMGQHGAVVLGVLVGVCSLGKCVCL